MSEEILNTPEIIEHVITDEDIANNPGLEKEVVVGETVELEMAPESQEIPTEEIIN